MTAREAVFLVCAADGAANLLIVATAALGFKFLLCRFRKQGFRAR
jgi:hypothetical protein